MNQQGRKQRTAAAKDEDERQYTSSSMTLDKLDKKYPNRPKNHSKTFCFSELYLCLLNPLNENKKPLGPSRPGKTRASKISPHKQRRSIIENFISRWRDEVGNDFYPALRLILPDKDRDRGVYGLKESAISKILIRLLKIDKNSDDGYSLLKWKLPGSNAVMRMAGDFAGRCYDVLKKRQMRSEPGDMTMADVNELLDQLAAGMSESDMLSIFEEFYARMNAEELMWLIRIILKEMKVGATERTFLNIWHPDAEALFNVSSSLRRVCWELYNPDVRIDEDKTWVTLMQCFQPQLAQFQTSHSFENIVQRLGVTSEKMEYWIEQKLDGERMQMHMAHDDSVAGGKQFAFWSRKGKDYTYLYGKGLEDNNSALTRHLKNAFVPGVKNIILDGEMVTWDPELDKIMAFGTLKTAALSEQKNPLNGTGPRPLFKVFDILYLNGTDMTRYELQVRNKALTKAVLGVHGRLEIHSHKVATSPDAIQPLLRDVVAEAGEGLVLKNPQSIYRLNSRNDDWIKVKPEYLNEFGESLDCVVIGGYYGSGRRGGTLSSFLCGLRAGLNQLQSGAGKEKCYSFFKVGGGFNTNDYAEIRYHTEGKWHEWDAMHPPVEYIELAGGHLQYERPDVWIRPSESIVFEVKAASVSASDQFAFNFTLRFPRFRRLRLDKAWDQALSVDEFVQLQREVEEQQQEKSMSLEDHKRRPTKRVKRELVVAGTEGDNTHSTYTAVGDTESGGNKGTKIFEGITFCILSDCAKPRKTKAQLENLVKEHGGRISQRADVLLEQQDNNESRQDSYHRIILIAEKKVIKVASLLKSSDRDIVRPRWIWDCLIQNEGQGYLLPYETVHLFHMSSPHIEAAVRANTDRFGDSYCRDIADLAELKEIVDMMASDVSRPLGQLDNTPGGNTGDLLTSKRIFLDQLEEHGHGLGHYHSILFRRCKVFLAQGASTRHKEDEDNNALVLTTKNYLVYGGGTLGDDPADESVTHIVLLADRGARSSSDGGGAVSGDRGGNKEFNDIVSSMRADLSMRIEMPRIVTWKWVEESFREGTLLDEDRFKP